MDTNLTPVRWIRTRITGVVRTHMGRGRTTQLVITSCALVVALVVGAVLAVGGTQSRYEGPQPVVAQAWLMPPHTHLPGACYIADRVWVSVGSHAELDASVVLTEDGVVEDVVRWRYPLGRMTYDSVRGHVYCTSGAAPYVEVFDARTCKHVRTIQLEYPAYGLSVLGNKAYANAAGKAILQVLDLNEGTQIDSVELSQPGLESVGAAGQVYVGTGVSDGESFQRAAIEVVDPSRGRVVKKIAIPGRLLNSVTWDGVRYVYAASGLDGSLVRIDTQRQELDGSLALDIGDGVGDVVVDRERGMVLLSCSGLDETLAIVSLAEGRIVKRLHAGDGLMAVKRDGDGRIVRVWVPNHNDNEIISIAARELFATER